MSHIVTMNNITGDAPVSGGGPAGEQIGSGTQMSDAMITYTVDDAEWKQGIDYDEAGRPFKLIRTGLGDVATASSTGGVTFDYSVDTQSYKQGGTTGLIVRNNGTNSLFVGLNAGFSTPVNTIAIGADTASLNANSDCVAVGYKAMDSTTASDTVAIGVRAGSGGGLSNNVFVGNDCTAGFAGNCTLVGHNATCVSGQGTTAIGKDSSTGSFADNSTALGQGATTSVPNEVVVGNGAVVKIRPMSTDSKCDLGDSTYKWGNITTGGYLQTTGISQPTGVEGMVYFDSTRKALRFYDGTKWHDLQTATRSIVPAMTAAALPTPFVISTSSEQVGFEGFNAFTGDLGDYWLTGVDTFDSPSGDANTSRTLWGVTQNMEWIKVDLGSEYTISNVSITAWIGGWDRSPADFDIRFSTDDTTASTGASFTGLVWTAGEEKEFDCPGTARYVAITTTKMTTAGIRVMRQPKIEIRGY